MVCPDRLDGRPYSPAAPLAGTYLRQFRCRAKRFRPRRSRLLDWRRPMGFLDVLNGMQNQPPGQRDPATAGGGMSPITMAVLGLLAYKAVKNFAKLGRPALVPLAWHLAPACRAALAAFSAVGWVAYS